MLVSRVAGLLAAAMLLGAPTAPSITFGIPSAEAADWPANGAELSVMTFNVAGLPWPVARNRQPAFAAIAGRLRQMRSRGVQPHVVLLQEAFCGEAKRIGELAGYRYSSFGPAAAANTQQPPLGREFADAAQWLKGERGGSVIDSGLVVLSDYPIVRTQRFAFPQGACAGYDCLAAKGVLAIWIEVPGAGQAIAVVNTHLNSRKATHVSAERADRAHAWQIAVVRDFVSSVVAADTPIIFGGDLNAGQVAQRKAALIGRPLIGPDQRDGLTTVMGQGNMMPGSRAEAEHIVARNKDRIFSRNGGNVELSPVRAWVPFKMSTGNGALSDHAGFVIDYSIQSRSQSAE